MTETKAQFAKRLGVNKSTVTRYGQAGRLVLAPNGKVRVEESLNLINGTKGHRIDVSEKHGQMRDELPDDATGVAGDEINATASGIVDRAKLQRATLIFGNNIMKIEMALSNGTLVLKEDVVSKAGLDGRAFRIGMERLIDNLAPVLVNVHGRDARLAAISSAVTMEFGG